MIPDTLIEAVRKQLGEDGDDDFNSIMRDVASHGADTGWPGFTYTMDCVEFHDANEDAIWELLYEDGVAQGDHDSVAEFIGTFHRKDMGNDLRSLKNLLAWYTLEAVARHIVDAVEVDA